MASRLELAIRAIRKRVRKLSKTGQLAMFAWSCERLAPWYESFVTFEKIKIVDYRSVLDIVWRHVQGTSFPRADAEAVQATLMDLTFEREYSILANGAMSAASALYSAVDACTHTVDASIAVEFIFDRVRDVLMAEVWNVFDKKALSPHDLQIAERQFAIHPWMDSEIRRCEAVVTFLEKRTVIDKSAVRSLQRLAM